MIKVVVACVTLALCSLGIVAAQAQTIVISQVYGGGGNTGATYVNDFIELKNIGLSAQNLAGMSVQYTPATNSTWQVTVLPNTTLQPGQYFLVQEAPGAGGVTNLPTPDATGFIALSATNGKIAVVNGTNALLGSCPTQGVVDFLGYGENANCFEGNGPALGSSNTIGVLRINCKDTNDNAADFSATDPQPRNKDSTIDICAKLEFAKVLTPSFQTAPCTVSAPVKVTFYLHGASDVDQTPAQNLVAELGIGPNTDPSQDPLWVWRTSVPDPSFNFANVSDQYALGFFAHRSGTFDFAYRLRYRNLDWVYVDDDGTDNGYSTAAAGKVTVTGNAIFCDRFDDE
jgi:Lamin Tail Domain